MQEDAPWRVLIVDDARLLREFVRDALVQRFPGLEVIEAGNIADGYRYARQSRPMLVLLDVSLPDGNGLKLAKRIRRELPETSVCICTSHDWPEYRQAAADAGVVHFISKQDGYWSETENLVRTELQLMGSDWDERSARVKAGP